VAVANVHRNYTRRDLGRNQLTLDISQSSVADHNLKYWLILFIAFTFQNNYLQRLIKISPPSDD